MAELKLLFF